MLSRLGFFLRSNAVDTIVVNFLPAKMASTEFANKDEGEAVRQELKGVREQLETTKATLARKEVRDAFRAMPSTTMDHRDEGSVPTIEGTRMTTTAATPTMTKIF